MTIQEVMERTGTNETGLVIAWVKDAIHLIQSTYNENVSTWSTNIADGTRDYAIPANLIKIMSVSVKDTSKDKYVRIRRIASQPSLIKDNSPE
jgi:hypothetical protein|tara:strand:- start:1332 stop:1610 length:279 start_codon:yes stop_codon:yes gene_type:complete